jgi:ATP-dependent protease ClpP protease subunit
MTTKAFYLTDKTLDSLPQWLIDNRESGPLDIYINSTGGDILSAITSISLISSHKDTITTYITGSAESAALMVPQTTWLRPHDLINFGFIDYIIEVENLERLDGKDKKYTEN